MAADQDGVLEDIVLVGQGLQDGILEILPILARLCDGSVCIADGDGRCRHRVDRNGAIVPIREVHASALVRKVSRTRRPEWEQDKNSSDLRLALPVGNRTLEIVRHSHSKTVRRPVPLGAVSEFGRTLDQPVAPCYKGSSSARDCGALCAKYRWDDIVGGGFAIAKAIARSKAAAGCDAPVFLVGESGTGKELFAQAIHNASARSGGPFVAINCSALPDSLVDSLLFGYSEGSFTGASKGGRPGVFEQANGGTLLLDEITEISVDIQGKLLRVLQEREVCRIGSVKPIPIDIRIIVTSNRDLHRQMRDGLFREDLFYRLNVIDIRLPPLRDRREDIPAIASRMIDCLGQDRGNSTRKLHPDAMDWLVRQPWPGNIRELRNVLERAVILAEGDVLFTRHFAPTEEFSGQTDGAAASVVGNQLCQRIAHAEEASIRDALRRNSGHRGKTAAELGISVTTLWRRLRRISGAPGAAAVEHHS